MASPAGPDQKVLSFESVFLMSIQSKYRSHYLALPLALQPGNSDELPSSHLQCERLRITPQNEPFRLQEHSRGSGLSFSRLLLGSRARAFPLQQDGSLLARHQLHEGVPVDIFQLIGPDLFAVSQDRYRVTKCIYFIHPVGYEHDSDAVLFQLLENFHDNFEFLREERRRDFIDNKQPHLLGNGFCELEHVLLAFLELVNP